MDKVLMLLLSLWSKGYTLNSQTIWDSIKLMKLLNIQSKPTALLTPLTYGTSPVEYQYLINVNSDTSATEDEKLYGKWSKNANNLLEIL